MNSGNVENIMESIKEEVNSLKEQLSTSSYSKDHADELISQYSFFSQELKKIAKEKSINGNLSILLKLYLKITLFLNLR